MPTTLVEDGRYLVLLLDNSESARGTVINGKSLFAQQLEAVEELVTYLMSGKAHDRTEILTVCFHGAVGEGWYPLHKVPRFDPSHFEFMNCTPLLDFLSAVLDHLESVFATGFEQDVSVRCGFMLMSDGLEGVDVGGKSFPVSVTSEEQVRLRMEWFLRREFFANALAMGADGGLELKNLLLRVGFPKDGIRPTSLGAGELRRAFGDMSYSTFRGMGL
jgi:hypothetical protein